MKFRIFLALAGLAGVATTAFGSTNVSYTATGDPNGTPDGMDNSGNAVDVWTLTHSGSGTAPNNYGSFLGSSGQNGGGSTAGAGTSAWGLYANGEPQGTSNEVDIGHTFTGGMLALGQTVSIQFDGGYVDTGSDIGIRLYNSTGFAMALSFVGGSTGYNYYDSSNGGAGNAAGFGYTPNGFTFSFTQLTATTYRATVVGQDENVSWTSTVSGAPTFIQVYDNNAGQGANGGANWDVFANNLAIVPEPGSLACLGSGGAAACVFLRRRRAGARVG